MGADIHGVVEIVVDSDYSRAAAQIELHRDYELFGLMAGVRGARKPTIKPRGFPDVVSWQVKDGYQVVGGHSASWMTLAELKHTAERQDNPQIELLATIAFMDVMAATLGADKVRFTFWFDS